MQYMPKATINSNQKKAIEHKSGALLVVAGAGTGKTRVITERIKYLIQKQKVNSNSILALTFTEKAAKEMSDRVGDVMPLGYEEPWINTFHSFADRILKKDGLEIGLNPSYKIISGADQWLLVRRNLFKFKLAYFRPMGNPTKFISAILSFISRLQDESVSVEEFTEFSKKFQGDGSPESELEQQKWAELAHVYSEYTRLKSEKSVLDFGDLITNTLLLFKSRPNILKKYKDQFKHILVDEFQDTNYAQYDLIKMLFDASEHDRSLLVVGDDSQSIYKFRGAAVSNILQFKEDFPKADMVTLVDNYRSTQEILDPAYKLIVNNNPDTLESKLGISKELKSKIGYSKISPEVIEAENQEVENELIVQKILEILGKEPQFTFKDFAILARANSHLEPIILALRKHEIPYQLVGNRGLYDRDEVRDIIAFLKILINPIDSVNLYKVLNIPTLHISHTVVAKLLADTKFKKVSLWQSLQDCDDDNTKTLLKKITDLQTHMAKFMPAELVYELVNSINYLSQFTKVETVDNVLCIKNLDLFLQRVKKFENDFYSEKRDTPTTNDFVDYLELVVEAGENPAQAEVEDIDTVNLMTVHASKGLEFPVVFMPALIAGRFPTRNRKDPIMIPEELIRETLPTGDEHIQEERRLFYVGMTRAQKYLFLTYSIDYGGRRESTPSGYLNEIGITTQKVSPTELSAARQNSLFGMASTFRDPLALEPRSFVPYVLSYSQIDKYETCPLQYKCAYVLRIPTLPNSALSFGSTIHDTLRDFHTKKTFDKNVTYEDLMEMYKNNWQPLGYLEAEHREQRFEDGKDILRRYFEKHTNEEIKHKALEKNFNIKIGDVKFTGRIDRMDDLGDGKVEIVDYKTGQAKSQKEVDKDEQVTTYAIAAKEAFGLEAEKLSLYFVESGEKISTTRTQEQLDAMKDKIRLIIEKMKRGDFEATPGIHCSWCDFKEICPFA